MSFLHRRNKQRPRDSHPDGFALSALPENDTASIQTPSLFGTPSIRSTTLRKRLSSFTQLAASLKRGRSQSSQAIGHITPYPLRADSRSPSPAPSLEIRRPSGLGRRASVIDLLAEDPEEGTNEVYGSTRRKHSISTPELTLRPDGLLQWSHYPPKQERKPVPTAPLPPPPPQRDPVSFASMPTSLLQVIFSFATTPDLAAIVLTCKAFVEPARTALYEHVDLLRSVNGRRVEKCIGLLASRRDLAGLVHRFSCDVIPTGQAARGRPAFSMVTFAIALNNSTALTCLTMPRFDATLLFHTTFQLTEVTLLCDRMSNDELHDTFEWLQNQPTLTSLSFPNLVLDDENCRIIAGAGSQQEQGAETEQDRDSALTISPALTPKLTNIRGPALLVAALVPGRPLTSVRLHIHSTIFDGLRPSALIAGIKQTTSPLTRLGVITTVHHKIDARTIERLLMTAGSEFGAHVRVMEVDSTLDDEALRKVMSAILPRYRALQTLRLDRKHFPLPCTPPATPPLGTPLAEASSPASSRPSPLLPPRMTERTSLTAWTRHCSTLRTVVFPTSAEWNIARTDDDASSASFKFQGIRGAEA